MECISEETVDLTWQTIAAMPPQDAAEAMFEFSQAQPNLLGFVMAFADDLETDAQELSTYILFVVYSMFMKSATAEIPMITEDQIRTQYEATQDLLGRLHDSDDPAEDMDVVIENQPWVYRYVTEALLEQNDDPADHVEISEEEFGEIVMMMKTVIDVVDVATN